MKLTQQQLEQFDREGYLFLPNLFSAEEAAFLKGEAEAIYQMTAKKFGEKSGVARQHSQHTSTTRISSIGLPPPSYRARRATPRWQGVHAPIQS